MNNGLNFYKEEVDKILFEYQIKFTAEYNNEPGFNSSVFYICEFTPKVKKFGIISLVNNEFKSAVFRSVLADMLGVHEITEDEFMELPLFEMCYSPREFVDRMLSL